MRYYRSLPCIKHFFIFLNSLLLLPKLKLEFSSNHVTFLFSRSRFGILSFIDSLTAYDNLKKIKIWLPDFYCWEVAKIWDKENVVFQFYSITEEYNPLWSSLDTEFEKKDNYFNVFILVSYFGRTSEVEKARTFCKINNFFLIFDETHIRFTPVSLRYENEILLLSPYKHFPISNGAMIVVCRSNNHFSSFHLLNKHFSKVKKSTWLKHISEDLFWFTKSYFVLIFKIIRIANFKKLVPNGHDIIYNNTNNKYLLGISDYNYKIIKNNNPLNPMTVKNCYYNFYQRLFEILSEHFICKMISDNSYNSHLFGIHFNSIEDAEFVYNLLSKFKLPVLNWPDYNYVNSFDVNLINDIVLKITNNSIFLSTSNLHYDSSNFINNYDNIILKNIKDILIYKNVS